MKNKIYTFLFVLVLSPILSCRLFAATESPSSVAFPVGELGESWYFPSDHLPVGFSIGNVHAASWNVLNTRYIYHILTNQQGLKDSLIVTSNVPVDMLSQLTLREKMIVRQVLEMLDHPTHPRSVLSLQEVGGSLFEELSRKLPANQVLVTAFPDDLAHGDIFIYDSSVFDWCWLRAGVYQTRQKNTYMTLALREKNTGILYQFVQSHVPAGPGISAPARKELAKEILANFDKEAVTIVMGDMNRSPDYLLKDFQEAAKDLGMKKQPLKNLWVPYATHIDCNKRASWIDNLFYFLPSEEMEVRVNAEPALFFQDLVPVVQLLKSLRPHELDLSFEIWCRAKALGKVVVYGNPYSGKKEQIALALKNEGVYFFNLKEEFLKDYFKHHGIEEESEKIRMQVAYKEDGKFREIEYDWVNEHALEISEKILSSPAEIVVFEDFDFSSGQEIDTYKLSTLLVVATIAKMVGDGGKRTVLEINDQAMCSKLFWDEVSDLLSISREDVIAAKFLKGEEENILLAATNLSEDEKNHYKGWASGIPTAYLPLMDFLLKRECKEEKLGLSLHDLITCSLGNMETIWSRLQAIESEEIIHTLQTIATEDSAVWGEEVLSEIDRLINTGLIRKKDGEIIMPSLVREVIRAS